MIEQRKIARALESLIGWLETWRDVNGAYNGFVVHRTEAKRMRRVHDTAWTQSAIIRGYGNLCRKSSDERWRKRMLRAADCLAGRYDPETGRLQYTGHEDDRFQSLVSCALGVCALLSISDVVDDARREEYHALCADHARRYWIGVLWVGKEGAFKFAEYDYLSPHEDRFVVNFNTMAAEALLAIYNNTQDDIFRAYALKVGDWLKERWAHTQKVNREILHGHVNVSEDLASEWMAPGGFSYQFTPSRWNPDNYVTIYNGLSLRGFRALYDATGDERYLDMIKAQSDYLLAMRDPETRLFYHTACNGRIEKNPQFIAGSGMTLRGLYEVRDLIGSKWFPEDTVHAILNRTYSNGSVPGFFGKNNTGRRKRRGGGIVWEDIAASTNWNAQWFEYLTCIINHSGRLAECRCDATEVVINKRFIYRDSPKSVQIFSWWPPRSWGFYLYRKKSARATFSFYPVAFYGCLRQIYKRVISSLKK